ncbi:glycoside hydrolase family 43 protein [Diplodia corticola]|uniref:Glycoside hydrolase family 43 protein n=1 Tax=Diplodia corticola TaxID=236234 RepID=A0A1J9RBR5_9PEZI|nr:glycoside hydrolase family 43 protein [Diplodia corticola]OJD39030.1 glycoside hydrolase family 43 protein [Diplodia corticola]
MRSNYFSAGLVCAYASAVALAAPFAGDSSILSRRADSSKVGFLAAFWKTNETGIFFAISTNDDPLSFTPINGGEALFVPTLGQKTVRDLSIVPGSGEEEATKWYLLATDLNIDDYSSWDAASANGSKALLIWDSTDLVNWTNERLITVEDDTAGMAWAPDAIYDPDAGNYMVHWAAKFFAENDTAHNDGAIGEAVMRYAHTSDFQTFTAPQTYIDRNPNSTIDLSFLKINDTAYVRFWAHDGIHTEVGYDGLFGSFEEVGDVVTDYEGAYAIWDNTADGVAYMIADKVGSDAGIRLYGPSDPTTGVWVQDTAVDMTYMRHGSVLALTQEQYDALAAV